MTRYDLLYYLASPIILPYLAWRRLSRGKYRESSQGMLGHNLPVGAELDAFDKGSVWIHAVSVGEVTAARSIAPYVRAMLPDMPLVVSTVTETGQEHARRTIQSTAHAVTYFPVDLSWNVGRFFDAYNPKVVILMETELWPNFLTLAARRGAQVFMANGKISDRSFPRYRRARGFLRPAFDAIRAFAMQTEADAERMAALTQRPDDVHVAGNCKFDMPMKTIDEDVATAIRQHYRLGPKRPTVVVGSTHPTEERVILDAFDQLKKHIPDLLLILSPRHPERFAEVFTLCRKHPARWRVNRATAPPQEENAPAPDVFLLDTMGELARTYGLGDVAVVAGSFCRIGGHNILEAAAHRIPVIVGPNMHAQRELDRLFAAPDSGCIRTTHDRLARTILDLLEDDANRTAVGQKAWETAVANQGAARRTAEIIYQCLQQTDISVLAPQIEES